MEDFDTHECDLPLKECRTIEVAYFRDDSYKNKKIMTVWGIDGIRYTFEVIPRKPIPIVMTPDEFLQYHQSDEDLTEPGGIKFKIPLGLRMRKNESMPRSITNM